MVQAHVGVTNANVDDKPKDVQKGMNMKPGFESMIASVGMAIFACLCFTHLHEGSFFYYTEVTFIWVSIFFLLFGFMDLFLYELKKILNDKE